MPKVSDSQHHRLHKTSRSRVPKQSKAAVAGEVRAGQEQRSQFSFFFFTTFFFERIGGRRFVGVSVQSQKITDRYMVRLGVAGGEYLHTTIGIAVCYGTFLWFG